MITKSTDEEVNTRAVRSIRITYKYEFMHFEIVSIVKCGWRLLLVAVALVIPTLDQ